MLRTLGYIVVLASFVGGPATELALAIHLAQAGPSHHGDNCPICIQLTIGSATPVVDPPALITRAEPLSFECSAVAWLPALPAFERSPLVARAPPDALLTFRRPVIRIVLERFQ